MNKKTNGITVRQTAVNLFVGRTNLRSNSRESFNRQNLTNACSKSGITNKWVFPSVLKLDDINPKHSRREGREVGLGPLNDKLRFQKKTSLDASAEQLASVRREK